MPGCVNKVKAVLFKLYGDKKRPTKTPVSAAKIGSAAAGKEGFGFVERRKIS